MSYLFRFVDARLLGLYPADHTTDEERTNSCGLLSLAHLSILEA